MKTNHVREKLRAGEACLGSFLGLGSPNVAELMACAGFDWLVIETEHNALDTAQVQHMLMAMNGTDTVPIVRIPSAEPTHIQRALDIGAMGILVPLIKTPQEAEAIVAATRYPPQGKRSYGPLRAERYTFDRKDYMQRANEQIVVMLIIETREAVENLEAIAAVPGVDALFLGPFDLCLSMGLNPLEMPLPEVDAVVERMLQIHRETGVAAGVGTGNPADLPTLREQGFTMIAYGPDYGLLADAARAGLSAFGRQTLT